MESAITLRFSTQAQSDIARMTQQLSDLQRQVASGAKADDLRGFGLSQVHRPSANSIQLPVQPDNGLPGGQWTGRRQQRRGQTAVQMPREEQGCSFRVDVWQPPAMWGQLQVVGGAGRGSPANIDRCRDESRHGTQECVRHVELVIMGRRTRTATAALCRADRLVRAQIA